MGFPAEVPLVGKRAHPSPFKLGGAGGGGVERFFIHWSCCCCFLDRFGEVA